MKRLIFFIVCCISTASAIAQGNPGKSKHPEFNFWLGHWNAYSPATGNIVGENHLLSILDSSVIFENWTDVLGTKGKSFTAYDEAKKCWRQVWTDNSGDMSETYGYLTGDTMTFISAPHLNPRGRMVVNRMRIIKKSNDELLQTGELSLDNTTTWISTFSFIYRRKTTAGLTNKPFSLEVYGMKVLVPDLVKAKSFYNETLGFPLDNLLTTDNKVVLYTNSIRLILQEDKNVQPITEKAFGPNSLTMQVNNMDSAYAALKAKGVQFIKDEKRKEGVGYSMHFVDPFGNKISLLQQTAGTVKQLAEPKIYNCGLYVSDMAKARDFYANKLGFAERSQQYLPDDMPLGYTDNKFAFMLHVKRKDMPNTNKTNMRLVFLTNNIDQAFTEIKKISPNADLKNGVIVFTDAVDIVSEVIESKF